MVPGRPSLGRLALLALLAGCAGPATAPHPHASLAAAASPVPTPSPSGTAWPSPLARITLPPTAAPLPTPEALGVVSRFAGSLSDFDGAGDALQLHLRQPTGIALAADGSFYLSDNGNSRIYFVDAAGHAELIAGGPVGFADGPGASARFENLQGIALDAEHQVLYVADAGTQTIRRIDLADAQHAVTTIAGSFASGFQDGVGTAARFGAPVALALSGATLYVGEVGNCAVRKVDLTPGKGYPVTTLAGTGSAGFADGPGAQAKFGQPLALALGHDGTVYVGDATNNRVRAIAPNGAVTTLAGTGTPGGTTPGPGATTTFQAVHGVAIDPATPTRLYVSDAGQARVFAVDLAAPTHPVSLVLGTTAGFVDGPVATAQVFNPANMAAAGGKLWVIDYLARGIRRFDGTNVQTVAGVGPVTTLAGPAVNVDLLYLGGIAASSTRVFAIDRLDSALISFDLTAADHTAARVLPTGGALNGPLACAVAPDGRLCLAQADFTLSLVDLAGPTISHLSGAASGDEADGPAATARFLDVTSLAYAPDGTLYVGSGSASPLRAVAADGTARTVVPSSFKPRLGVLGVAVLPDGGVAIADAANNQIWRVPPGGGQPTVIAGSGGEGGGDGPGLAATFVQPCGIAVTPSGDLVVVETLAHRVRLVGMATADHPVTTLAGSGSEGLADGTGREAVFSHPQGVAVNGHTAYVVDQRGTLVRQVTLP